jgi:hypothetical protein
MMRKTNATVAGIAAIFELTIAGWFIIKGVAMPEARSQP